MNKNAFCLLTRFRKKWFHESMTAMKVKTLQVKRMQTPEPEEKKKQVTDAVVKMEEREDVRAGNGLWGLLTNFLMVGGDFV